MRKQVLHTLVLVLLLLNAGCSEPQQSSTPTALNLAPAGTPATILMPTPTWTPSSTPDLTLTVSAALSASPTATSFIPHTTPLPGNFAPLPIELPAPLIFTGAQERELPGLWMVDNSGPPRQLVDLQLQTDFDVSPDGMKVAYMQGYDIWVYDFSTGSTHNVTNSPHRIEQFPRWWPGRDGMLVASLKPGEGTMCFFGYLTYIGLDGTYEVLDDQVGLDTFPAGSPDGKTVVYSGSSSPCKEPSHLWQYREGERSQQIDLAQFGLVDQYVEGISWSPDGRQLGLVTVHPDPQKPGAREHVVTLDLKTKTVRPLHEFWKFSTGVDYSSAPVWSSDDSWLVFYTAAWGSNGPNSDQTEFALWYMDAAKVQRVSPASATVWRGKPAISPDGQWIAVPANTGIGLFHVGDWQLYFWEVPQGVVQVDWITPPSQ